MSAPPDDSVRGFLDAVAESIAEQMLREVTAPDAADRADEPGGDDST